MPSRPLTLVCFLIGVIVLLSLLLHGSAGVSAETSLNVSGPIWGKAQAFARTADIEGLITKTTTQTKSETTVKQEVVSISDRQEYFSTRTSTSVDAQYPLASFLTETMPDPSLSFDGLQNLDNADIYNFLILPPDMTGDIGPDHYVQIVNSLFRVFDKDGNPRSPRIRISTLFESLATTCSTRNDGLANVLYDTLADRWLISQTCTAFPPFRQMIAVSETGNPLGRYFSYEFVMPNIRLNDFPKLGIWPDGYYMATDEFHGSTYFGSGMFAFDRKRMLAGDPNAGFIYFYLPDPVPIRRRGMLPADLDGLRPPEPGTPNIFVSYTANEYGDDQDAIGLFDFQADFSDPTNSTFTEREESPLSVPSFDPTSPDGRADISQPPPGEKLDSQSDRIAHRLAYRNQGTHESLVVNQTVRLTPPAAIYRAGVRVYEFRRSGASSFGVHTAATIGEPDSSRWIASVAQDHQSNVAVGYNFVSDEKRVSILYSGRLASDPPNQFRSEATLVEGTGVQKAFGWRWGEYSGMSVDPVDDCTFWLTNAYYTLESEQISDFTWLTRIGRFKYPECVPISKAQISGSVTDSLTGQPVIGALVAVGQYSRFADATGDYGPLTLLPGTYQAVVSANGYRAQTRVVNAPGGEITEHFILEPIPIAVESGTAIIEESCRVNNAAEPGETVTLNIGLRNTGARNATNLSAELLNTGGIIDAGPPQIYGALPAGGPAVTRPFTFTVSPTTLCGAEVTLSLRIRDGQEELGTLAIPLRTGELITAFSEDFDAPTAPELPIGWTTSTSQNHQLWRTSANRNQSPPNSGFSPAPLQTGINELVSPPFTITSPNAEISFRNWYELETTFLRNRLFDGSVLELKIGDGDWVDILAAGGQFLSGGYDGVIDGCCSNPLAGRQAWSGRSGANQVSEFITSRAKLPAAAQGNSVRLRWRIGTDIGTFREGQYIDDLRVTDGYACSCTMAFPRSAPFDFDGDGKTDLSLYDLNDDPLRMDLRVFNSSTNTLTGFSFGSAGDIPVYSDFDGDGKTDVAVFRPSAGVWYILRSSDVNVDIVSFGLTGDIPAPADFDGDGRSDIAVFRPATGVWYLLQSTQGFAAAQFGLAEDIPVPGDFDGDGRADIAVFRPSNGTWYLLTSASGVHIAPFGLAGDRPVAGDFDGDGKTDLVVFRPSERIWYMLRTTDGFGSAVFGLGTDQPLQADFDGDGKADIAVYRKSKRAWYFLRSSDGQVGVVQFGEPGENAVPGIFVP